MKCRGFGAVCATVVAFVVSACGGEDIDPAALARATASAPRFDDQLTLYAIPAPGSTGLTWSSPGQLVRHVLANEAGHKLWGWERTLGHAGVKIECAATASEPAASFSGSVRNSDHGEQFRELLLHRKIGLGILFDSVDGRLERPEELLESVERFSLRGRVATVRFGLSPATCRALVEYARSFDRAGVAGRYGLVQRPLHREGAGCSAFSMSFLDLANLVEPRFREAWSFSVRVPMELVGGSRNPDHEVGLVRLALTTRGWASPTEDGIDLFGWDPTQMFNWIRAEASRALKDGSAQVEGYQEAIGLVIDRRAERPRPELEARTFFRAP